MGEQTIAIPARPPSRWLASPFSTAAASADWSAGESGPRLDHYLKRDYGWDCTHLDGRKEAAAWCGHRIFVHHLVEISAWRFALSGAARRWEPKRMRLRLLAVVGGLASSGRRLAERWP
jgi:hypothetical protein